MSNSGLPHSLHRKFLAFTDQTISKNKAANPSCGRKTKGEQAKTGLYEVNVFRNILVLLLLYKYLLHCS